jgi:hypothetical protein
MFSRQSWFGRDSKQNQVKVIDMAEDDVDLYGEDYDEQYEEQVRPLWSYGVQQQQWSLSVVTPHSRSSGWAWTKCRWKKAEAGEPGTWTRPIWFECTLLSFWPLLLLVYRAAAVLSILYLWPCNSSPPTYLWPASFPIYRAKVNPNLLLVRGTIPLVLRRWWTRCSKVPMLLCMVDLSPTTACHQGLLVLGM